MKHSIRLILQLLAFVCMLVIFAIGFQKTDTTVDEKNLDRVKQAIQKAALECYSTEGFYPEDVSYLKEHYGLYLQEDLYKVRYEYVGSNIMPEPSVYRKGGN